MRFSIALLPILAAFARAQAGYNTFQNPFDIPSSGFSFTAGQQSTIRWTPTTEGSISLVLRSGDSNNLDEGTPIASTPEPRIHR